jgi:prepilin-type N-terminal cleavage/methylation domain-containing protein
VRQRGANAKPSLALGLRQAKHEHRMRRAFTLIELLVVIAIIMILCGLLGGAGLDALVALLIGWIRYPLRVFSERDIDWPNTLLCAMCLAALTLGVHFFGRWFASHRSSTWPWSRSFKLIGLVMLLFLAGIVGIGITHEVVWLATSNEPLGTSRRPAAHSTHSVNNLKQIGLALHGFHDFDLRFPAGATFDAHGRAMHGWQTMILPYVEQGPLFANINLQQPWNGPDNVALMKTQIHVFQHPAVAQTEDNAYALSHYAGNVHVLGVKGMTQKDITDGTSNTLLSGEVAQQFKPWGMPMNCRDPGVGLNRPDGFANPQSKPVAFLFADGTVRRLRADISPTVLKALATPRGGEKIAAGDLD